MDHIDDIDLIDDIEHFNDIRKSKDINHKNNTNRNDGIKIFFGFFYDFFLFWKKKQL